MKEDSCANLGDPDQVLASLEPDQLAAAKHRFPRRVLNKGEILLLWSLRIYLLFMVIVVVYQIWAGSR
jgi:hypothetical protein